MADFDFLLKAHLGKQRCDDSEQEEKKSCARSDQDKKRSRGERGGRKKRQKTVQEKGQPLLGSHPMMSPVPGMSMPISAGYVPFHLQQPQMMFHNQALSSTPQQQHSQPNYTPRQTPKRIRIQRDPGDRRCAPFEADGGVSLGFNFWMSERSQIIPTDIQDLIISILTGLKIPLFLRQKELKARSAIVAFITGADQKQLEGLLKTGFLKTFSSVPIRFSEHYGKKSNHREAEPAEKLFLWREEPSVPLKTLNGLSLKEVFTKYALIFEAVHTYWKDSIIFSPEQSPDDKLKSIQATPSDMVTPMKDEESEISLEEKSIEGKQEKNDNSSAKEKTETPSKKHEGKLPNICHGIVRRMRSGDKGRWFIEEDGKLTIEWWNFPEDNLIGNCSPDKIDAETLHFKTVSPGEGQGDDSESVSMEMDLTYGVPVPPEPTLPDPDALQLENKEKINKDPSLQVLETLCVNHTLKRQLGIPVSLEEEDDEFVEISSDKSAGNEKQDAQPNRVPETIQKLVAVDCEMSYTDAGLELTRVTLVSQKMETLYDKIVKPARPITNYNTEYSGISEKDMDGETVSLAEVQTALKQYVGPKTFMAGHSIDSDLRALKLIHHKIIDTSVLYPSSRGLPYKNSLKNLTKRYLGRKIQEGTDGHDSSQDACATLELVLLKANNPPTFGLPDVWETVKYPLKETIFNSINRSAEEALKCHIIGRKYQQGDQLLWSRLGMGYQRENDPVWICSQNQNQDQIEPAQCEVTAEGFLTAKSILNRALQVLEKEAAPDLVWLQLPFLSTPCEEHEDSGKISSESCPKQSQQSNGKGSQPGEEVWTTPKELDNALQALYEVAPDDCLMVVLVQPSLEKLTEASRMKIKSRWDAKSLMNRDYIAGSENALIRAWEDEDEENLIQLGADVLDGVVFLKCT